MGLLAEDHIIGLLGIPGGLAQNPIDAGTLNLAIFFVKFDDLSGVKLLRSKDLTPRGQAFRRLLGHGVEKFLTA